MLTRNAVKWTRMVKISEFTSHSSCQGLELKHFDPVDDGVNNMYNPRYAYGKQVTRTPALNKHVVSEIVSYYKCHSIGWYDPWYVVQSLKQDYDENDYAVQVAIIKNKVNNSVTKWVKNSKRNSVWKKVS